LDTLRMVIISATFGWQRAGRSEEFADVQRSSSAVAEYCFPVCLRVTTPEGTCCK